MNEKYEPIKLLPVFKDYLWGGTKLKTHLNKNTELEKVAESWELSTHKDGQSIVADGKYKGLTLSEYIDANGKDIIGKNAEEFEFFPILIKFIDAHDNLSVQVHPSDEYALENEGEYGKTEMWYIADCDEDAFIYYGLNRELSKEELTERIKNNTLIEVLNKVETHKGDVFFIPSGTIHAIGAGNLICEIQQNSNTTYRVYDYDRRDKNGNTRELHIEKAIDVSNLYPPETYCCGNEKILAKCDYFIVEKVVCCGEINFELSNDSFRSVVVVDGFGELEASGKVIEFKKGDSIFIPAQQGECVIKGECEIIISYV